MARKALRLHFIFSSAYAQTIKKEVLHVRRYVHEG